MKRTAIVLFFVLALLFLTGCTQPQSAPPAQPDVTQASATPEITATTVGTDTTTAAPAETVTVVHYIEKEKAWKDSNLRIAFSTPQSWEVSSSHMDLPEGSQGLEFKTTLVSKDTFYIMTFPISRNQDQDYRNKFRMWAPVPEESTVTINNIVFDRFESENNDQTQVAYVARKSSANDLGFSSVIYFVADGTKPFELDDYEKVVQSFTYLTKENVQTAAGTEIPRT